MNAARSRGDDRALKLLHIFPSFAVGGQQRRLAVLIDGLGPSFSHQVISLDGDLSAKSMLSAQDVSLASLVLDKTGFLNWKNIRRLRKAIEAAGADVLCTYNFGSIEAAFANAIGPRRPHVHHEDGFGADESNRQKRRRVLARRLLLRNASVAVPSESLERIARDVWGLKPARIRRIPVGIDVARFKSAPRNGSPVVVGAIGALRAEKNFARLIRCFEKASEGRDCRLVIYGAGSEEERLRALADASGSYAKISMPGAALRPELALAEFDIFALSSDTEQMPTSLLEAMASGLPAVATDVGDVRTMIGEAGVGFIVDPDDEAAYEERLRALIDDAGLRRKLGAAALRRAADFREDAMIAAFRALYREAAGG